MPFKKVGNNDYTSPSGRHFNSAQVRMYYANGGHFPGEKSYEGGGSVNKGYSGKVESYAQGGPVLGRTRDFMKEPDRFRKGYQDNPPVVKTDDDYGDKSSEPKGKDKSLKAVKPRG